MYRKDSRAVTACRTFTVTSLVILSCSIASAQSWSSMSSATGWDIATSSPTTIQSEQHFSSPGAYAAAGNILATNALADVRPFSAPTSRAHASSILDQSDPANATLRQLSESRVIYWPFNEAPHPVYSSTSVVAFYGLQIENQSGVPLNIVFGNHLQGVMFQWQGGSVKLSEVTIIEGLPTFAANVDVDRFGNVTALGGWQNAVFAQPYQDPYLGTLPGHRLNSFQFYGSRSLGSGETDTIEVKHIFEMSTKIAQVLDWNGVAVSDFTGTADMTIRAYDSNGVDRTSQIAITYVVPEPASIAALVAGIGFLARRRRA